MESSDEYTESPPATSAKKPAKEPDAYDYFLNKERAKRGAPADKGESDISSDEDEEEKSKEDPEIAKIRANMAKKRAEVASK